jgi:Protein of unknown function (DUF3574)
MAATEALRILRSIQRLTSNWSALIQVAPSLLIDLGEAKRRRGRIVERDISRRLIGWVLVIVCAGSIFFHAQESADAVKTQQSNAVVRGSCTNRDTGQLFARTELVFGRAKPNGSMVTGEEFRGFLDEIITPRFPDGLTVLSGAGQFRGSSGMIMREGAVFVILLYPAGNKDSSTRIEEIRDIYIKTFAQESVMRIDGESCVSF